MDGFDIVSIRVEHECPVVLAGVLRSQARGSVVAASRGKRGCVESVDLLAPVRGERHMDGGGGSVNGGDGEVGRLLESEVDLPGASLQAPISAKPSGNSACA